MKSQDARPFAGAAIPFGVVSRAHEPLSAAAPTWQGWSEESAETKAVTSTKLNPDAKVKNRLFPKTRSWFALESPLELLSPLSVLRILFALAAVTEAFCGFGVGWPGVNRAVLFSLLALTLVVWMALLVVKKVGHRACHALALLATAGAGVLAWAAHGSGLLIAAAALFIPIGVFCGLFFRTRSVVVYELIAAGCLAGAEWSAGWVHALVIGLAAAIALSVGALTVEFLARCSRREGGIDPDTGLLNDVGFAQRLRQRAAEGPVVVAAVVLQGIADAREALGFRVGSELLRRGVEDLGQVLPATAVIGRMSGDELVVADPLTPTRDAPVPGERPERFADAARSLATILADGIGAGRYLVGDVEVSLRAHVGLAVAPWDGQTAAELMRRASLSARRAASRGQVCALWEGGGGVLTGEDLELLADLRLAGERGELWVAYQPQVDARTSALRSVEALLRWDSPKHGSIPPGRFILLAERTGLVDRLTDWVIGAALDAQVRWREAGLALPVSVNLSAKTLTKPDLSAEITNELARRALPPECLTVEVTETAAAELADAVNLLRPLHDLGVRVSIDDFGSGYTSLRALPSLPLDELKVDQSFVRRSSTSHADLAILRSVCELAHRLGLQAVAEGVETEEVRARVFEFGFDVIQGYLSSPPLTEAALLAFATGPAGSPQISLRSDPIAR
jgi:EAL domain-containing protein (putative c-di-GMP-specific phosphodiesterase class I)/GGDEF domain-containing protein